MRELIEEIVENLRQGNYQSETAVREQIVKQVLDALGWNTNNPRQVRPEYEVTGLRGRGRRRVDYALFTESTNKSPHVIIEVKSVGNIETADKQLFEYAFYTGISLAILTDGSGWRIYYPFGQGIYEERLVRALNLLHQQHDEIEEYLSRYLNFEEVKSGNATDNAQKDLKSRTNRKRAKQAIPKAWQQIVLDKPDDLVDTLTQETARKAGGVAPDKDDIIAFLKGLKLPSETPDWHPPQIPPTRPTAEPPTQTTPEPPAQATKKQETASSKWTSSYTLFGKKRENLSPSKAYINSMRDLYSYCETGKAPCKNGEDFLNKLLAELPKLQLSQDKSAFSKTSKIGKGWFIHRYPHDAEKREILKIACKVTGIEFGSDSGLKIEFSNTESSYTQTPPARPAPELPAQTTKKLHTGKRASSYILFGEKREHPNSVEAYVEIMTRFADEYGLAFLNKLASELGEKNMSRDKSALWRPAKAGHGWFLRRKMPNYRKQENLKKACEVAGIRFGSDSGLKINFPNT